MADYYLTMPLDTIIAALPAAIRTTVNDVVELNSFQLQPADRKTVTTPLRRAILQLLAEEKKLTLRQLQKKLGRKQLSGTLSELEKGGYITLQKKFATTRPKRKTAYRAAAAPHGNPEDILRNAPRQLEAFRALEALGEREGFAETLGFSPAILNELVRKGVAEKTAVDIRSNFRNTYSEAPQKPQHLTDAQSDALDILGEAVRQQHRGHALQARGLSRDSRHRFATKGAS
jgi:primosomal protein N' (replication factor Y)